MPKEVKSKYVFVFGIIIILILVSVGSCYTINPGQYGVQLRFGNIVSIEGPGLHGKVPFIDDVIKMNVRIVKHSITSEASSSDLQTIKTVIALNYKLEDQKVAEVYKSIGRQEVVESSMLDPLVQETFKAVTARYTAEGLIKERDKVANEIKQILSQKCKVYGVDVKEINITHFEFTKEFTIAIEQKIVAEQLALKAKNDLKRIETEAQQKITEARGDTEALRLKRVNLTKDLILLDAIKKWDGKLPQVVGSGVPLLNLKSD